MIGKRLKAARNLRGLTQTELGAAIGLDKNTANTRISRYESETHTPDFATACKMAAVLDIPECYFYTVNDSLAALIIQFHEATKTNSGTLVTFVPARPDADKPAK